MKKFIYCNYVTTMVDLIIKFGLTVVESNASKAELLKFVETFEA